jgi:hypothetical protein
MPITDHSQQLDRIADDVPDIARTSRSFGGTHVLNSVLFAFEVFTLLAAGYHGLKGAAGLVLIELCVAVAVLTFHAMTLFIERGMHHSHNDRINRLVLELRTKAARSIEEAKNENLRVPPG